MKRNVIFTFMLLATLSISSIAHAITIDGRDYARTLSGNVNGNVGLWYGMQTGYSFGVFGDADRWTQVQITGTSFESEQLDDAEDAGRFSFEFKKVTGGPSGALASTDLSILTHDGDLLLSLQLAGEGYVAATPRLGPRGNFALTGLFEAVGGAWFTEGLVSRDFYASINYASGVIANSKDFHATAGSFTLFSTAPQRHSEVPEPASAALLALGAVCAAIKKRKMTHS